MADYTLQLPGAEIDARLAKVPQLETALAGKQATLVSGTNIKTINNESILGPGNIVAGDPNAVKYVSQTLTEEQKAQARGNINAASASDLASAIADISGMEVDIASLEAAVEAINTSDYVTAATLPTASASTMGHIYLIGPDANNNYDRYFTQESGGEYSWVFLGSTQIDLSTYATEEEVTQLEQKVANDSYSSVTSEDSSLDVVDGQNNILVRFKDGHIETKHFESRKVNVFSSASPEDSDLDVVDEDNNIILRLAYGHIKTKYFDSSDIKSAYADFKNPLKTYPTDVTKPLHIGQVNVQRKVDALCDLPWTPIRPMPSTQIGFTSDGTEDSNVVSGRKYFRPNVEITGIPYSSFGVRGKSVGCDISIETFMTALKNPNSVLYTIDLRDSISSPLTASYYGLNCSAFTNYIEGIYATCYGRNNRFAANRILRNPKNADALQIGDVIYLQRDTIDSGHAVIVYKIDKDEDGLITQIHEAEEDASKANKYSYTKQQFEERFFRGGYGYPYGEIYRNVDLVDNVLYEEFDAESYVYSDAVGLNLGNNANYNKGDNIPIEVTLFGGVSGFELISGSTVVGTYTVGDGTPGYGDTTIVTIDKSSLANGAYEVRPTNGVSQYFCLASPGIVSVLKDDKGNISVSVSGHSSNISPYGVLLISSRTTETTRGLYLMDGEDNVVVPADWIEFINTTNDIAKLSVIFRNQYGNIYSEIVNI